MFAAICFDESQINLVIPFKWIYSFNPVNWLNDGINPSLPHKIFFSNNFDEKPNFNLPIGTFSEDCHDVGGCYMARIRKLFGNKIYFH